MTLLTSWVRKRSDGNEELIIASDSRINSAGNLDCAPKILPLPRGDAAIAFAGDTYFGYPLILQLQQAVHTYSPLLDRAEDFSVLRTHTLAIFNSMVDSFDEQVAGIGTPDSEFLLAGYSWKQKSFKMAAISYLKKEKKFAYHPSFGNIRNFTPIVLAGDKKRKAKKNLTELLQQRFGEKIVYTSTKIRPKKDYNMEPFEILRDILRETDSHDTVGGPPQMVKITSYMQCRRLAVRWGGKIYLGGRMLLDYENVDCRVLDPDTFEIVTFAKSV